MKKGILLGMSLLVAFGVSHANRCSSQSVNACHSVNYDNQDFNLNITNKYGEAVHVSVDTKYDTNIDNDATVYDVGSLGWYMRQGCKKTGTPQPNKCVTSGGALKLYTTRLIKVSSQEGQPLFMSGFTLYNDHGELSCVHPDAQSQFDCEIVYDQDHNIQHIDVTINPRVL